MHVLDIFLVVSIGQVIGWVVTIYAETNHLRLAGNLIVATTGSFVGGYLSTSLLSESSKFSMIFSAFFVAGILLYVVRYRNRFLKMYSEANPRSAHDNAMEEVSVGKQFRSIAITIILVSVIFMALGWFKAQQIVPL